MREAGYSTFFHKNYLASNNLYLLLSKVVECDAGMEDDDDHLPLPLCALGSPPLLGLWLKG
jgi:hypothetical protein